MRAKLAFALVIAAVTAALLAVPQVTRSVPIETAYAAASDL